jgi:putative endonuclease
MPWNLVRKISRSSAPHLELGALGERWAAWFLRRRGYKILVRQFHGRAGEIDLIAREGEWLVFVEVKARRSEQFGSPAEAVDRRKQKHISKVALEYLRLLGYPRVLFRFDIVEVVFAEGLTRPTTIRVIQNAFDLPEPYIY